MNCITCQGELKRRDQKKFCSRSCAAKHNNVVSPKRKSSKRSAQCRGCDNIIYRNKNGTLNAFCSTCRDQRKHYRNGVDRDERTIEEVIVRKGTNKFDQIRDHAYRLYKKERANPSCERCGYTKHIEICHIKSVSSFPLETKLKVVNARENILILCPNCHWEFDHDQLNLDEIKSAPGQI